MELLSLLVQLIDFIKSFVVLWFPVKYTVVDEGSQGVRFTFGKPSSPLGRGIHWATCGQVFHNIQVLKIKSEVNQCENFTKDCVPICVYGNYTYDITDAAKFITKSEDSHWLLVEVVEQEIFSWFADRSFEQCHAGVIDGSLTEHLKNAINTKCAEFDLGIDVTFVRISDWKVMDSTILKTLALDHLWNNLSQYEGLNSSLVALVAGAQPVFEMSD